MDRLVTSRRLLVRAGVLGGIAGAAALIAVRRGPAEALAGTPVPTRPAPPLDLVDDTGRPFDEASLRGQPAWVTFGYTSCPDVCPTLLATLAAARDQAAAPVRIVFVTLDPAQDDPTRLRDYLAAFADAQGHAPIGLTGTPAQTARAAAEWGISWRRAGAFLDHTAQVSFLDPEGRLRLRYGFAQASDPAALARDARLVA